MIKNYHLLLVIVMTILLNACTTSKSVQKEIQTLQADLFYELTSPEYKGEITKDVYLNFIHYSNLNYYTTVKKKKTVFIPLILYNFSAQTFEITLGENSLSQTYREFLTEALLAECNSSTAFHLIDNKADLAPDSAYLLDVKIIRNETNTRIKLQESVIPWFDEDMEESFLSFTNNKTKPAITQLDIQIKLSQAGKIVHNKTYSIKREQNGYRQSLADSYQTNDASLQIMAKSLSLATKQIVEDISTELHLLLF